MELLYIIAKNEIKKIVKRPVMKYVAKKSISSVMHPVTK